MSRRTGRPRRGPKGESAAQPYEGWIARARDALQDGRMEEAQAAAGHAVREDRRRPEGYMLLGEIHARLGELQEAVTACQRAVQKARGLSEHDPGEEEPLARALKGLARVQLLGDHLEQAAGTLDALAGLKAAPSPGVHQLLGEVHLRLGRPDRALAELPSAPAWGPDSQVVRALALRELGREQEAIVHLWGALLENPWILPALRREEPPDPGPAAAGAAGGGPEPAADLVERMRPYLEARPDQEAWVLRLAATETVSGELALVRSLLEGEGSGDDELLARLRDPRRCAAGAAGVLRELHGGREEEHTG